jgi:DNA polymerase III alpha subunit
MKADIDIDLPSNFQPSNLFGWTRASMEKDGKLLPHPCGYYPQKISIDPVTKLAAIPYEAAEEIGFYKLDFLHLGVYDHFKTREEIEGLLKEPPDWGLLLIPTEQVKLFQLSKHGELLTAIKPRSVEQLADVLALIRPGKRGLLKLYQAQPDAARRILYAKDETGYSFKKSHAIAYALVIVLQLHLISAGII